MARAINKLQTLKIEKMKKPGRYSDGLGLWLQISRWKTKSWLFQYSSPSGKVRQMGLGALHTIKLARARELAELARRQVRDGIDPLDDKKRRRTAEQREQAKRVTFKAAAEQFIEARRDTDIWKNDASARQWQATFQKHAFDKIGSMFVGDITKADVLDVVEPIWKTRTETAARLRARIENVLDLAIQRDWREGPNPAALKGLGLRLPKKKSRVRHHPALAYDEIGAFMHRLRQTKGMSASALEFTVLCASRTGEVIGATWDEIDLEQGLWTIPAERMKAGDAHKVPLSARALEILRSQPRDESNAHVFIGSKPGAGLSNMAMLELLRGMKPGLTVHGFRSTFRDWCAEETSFPNHVAEMALAHVIADNVESAYRRGVLLKKRRQLMEAWAARCDRPDKAKSNNVTAIRGHVK